MASMTYLIGQAIGQAIGTGILACLTYLAASLIWKTKANLKRNIPWVMLIAFLTHPTIAIGAMVLHITWKITKKDEEAKEK